MGGDARRRKIQSDAQATKMMILLKSVLDNLLLSHILDFYDIVVLYSATDYLVNTIFRQVSYFKVLR